MASSQMPPAFTLAFIADQIQTGSLFLKEVTASLRSVFGLGIIPLCDLTYLNVYNIIQHLED